MLRRKAFLVAALIAAASLASAASLAAQNTDSSACPSCATWNAPQHPFRVFGNTYYVGTHGLGSILITSDSGDILIDGALPESPPSIVANIRALGFRIEDVKLILNSHAHFDHAGGIAELQRLSGARVAASPWSADVLKAGGMGRGDPQYGSLLPIAPVANVSVIVSDHDPSHVCSPCESECSGLSISSLGRCVRTYPTQSAFAPAVGVDFCTCIRNSRLVCDFLSRSSNSSSAC